MSQDSSDQRSPDSRNNRELFLKTVRGALGHNPGAAPPRPESRPMRDEACFREVAVDNPERVARWVERAKSNGMTVHRTDAAGINAAVNAILSEQNIKSIMLNFSDGRLAPMGEFLQARAYQIHRWGEPDCAAMAFECDAAITDCRYGMADSGAFLVWSDAGFGRSTTLTIPLHIVLVPASRILPDLIDAMPRILGDNAGQMPSNVVVINGPSKTGDIEMKLVTGVHGPKYLYAIVVD